MVVAFRVVTQEKGQTNNTFMKDKMRTNEWKSEGSKFYLDKSDNLPTANRSSKTAALRSNELLLMDLLKP